MQLILNVKVPVKRGPNDNAEVGMALRVTEGNRPAGSAMLIGAATVAEADNTALVGIDCQVVLVAPSE